MQAATKVSVSLQAVPFPMATVETPCWRQSSVSLRPAWEWLGGSGLRKFGRRTSVSSRAPAGERTATLQPWEKPDNHSDVQTGTRTRGQWRQLSYDIKNKLGNPKTRY